MIIPSRPIQTNFTSGELSPRLYGRVDLEQYGNGAQILENFQVLNAGGITRRPGSGYCGPACFDTTPSRLLRFVVSDLTAYVLELAEFRMHIWRNRGLVVDDTGIPLTLVTPWSHLQLRDIRVSQSADVMYLCHPAVPPQKLSRIASNAFTLLPAVFKDGPYDTENTGDVGAAGVPAGSTSNVDSGTPVTPAAGGAAGGGGPAGDGPEGDGGGGGGEA